MDSVHKCQFTSPCSLLSYQAFHVSCQGHYIKNNPEKAISAVGQGATAF